MGPCDVITPVTISTAWFLEILYPLPKCVLHCDFRNVVTSSNFGLRNKRKKLGVH